MKLLPMLALSCTAIALSGCSTKSPEKDRAPVPIDIIPASAWNSTPQSLAGREHTPQFITIHHAGVIWAADSVPETKLKNLQSWGQRDKDWPDVPYHFMISPDGRVFEGRDTAYEPETNTNYDTMGHINIQLWGNFNEQRVTEAQLRSAVLTAAKVAQDLEIETSTIGGHLDRTNDTSCPGEDLHRYISDGTFEMWVNDVLAGKEPVIEMREPLPAGPFPFVGELFPDQ